MKKSHIFLLAFGLLTSIAFAQQKYVGWSTGYLPNYANFSVSKINWKCYNTVIWFSINGNSSGQVSGLSASQAVAFTTACHQNNTKAIICVGGGGAGSMFTSATTSSVLPTFINNLVSFMKTNAFDGIDIDWEDGINQSQYTALFKGLAAAFATITPKPMLTVATGMGLASNTAPVASYIDQLNLMSYYGSMTGGDVPIPQQMAAFTNLGVAKSKLGVGYGYDTDDEIDGPNEAGNGPNGNPTDIAAKCQYAINNGFGGIMVWEIDRAPAICDSVTASYVNKSAPAALIPNFADIGNHGITLTITNNGGLQAIHYAMHAAGFVDLGLYDMRGALVRNLTHGAQAPGMYSINLDNSAGPAVKPGAYVVRLATPMGSQAGEVLLK